MHKDRGCRGCIRLLRQILVFISEFYGLNMHNDNSMTISSTFIKMYLISVKPRPGKVLALKVLKLVWIWICSGEDKSRSKIFPASIFVTIVRCYDSNYDISLRIDCRLSTILETSSKSV